VINKRNLKRKIQPIPVDMVECGINTEEKVIWKTSGKKNIYIYARKLLNFGEVGGGGITNSIQFLLFHK
jgi:hypothetical protein